MPRLSRSAILDRMEQKKRKRKRRKPKVMRPRRVTEPRVVTDAWERENLGP